LSPPDVYSTHGEPHTSDEVKRIHHAAERGDAVAQFRLGRAFEDGDGVLPNDEQAHFWYRKGADQRRRRILQVADDLSEADVWRVAIEL
jgi:hypothetical protein